MTELAEWLSSELGESRCDCGDAADESDDDEEELIATAAQLEGEERLFYVLLTSHFDRAHTANEFYSSLDWKGLLATSTKDVQCVCKAFFHSWHHIGDHRRYFRCLPRGKKIEYTAEVLKSYKVIVQSEPYGSQARFFEIGGHPEFQVLYGRMCEIAHFRRRLPRFDHLERLARTHDFYIVPARFFAEDDQGGPRDGLTYLLFGKRLRKKRRELTKYLLGKFPAEWNAAVAAKYHVPQDPSLREVMRALEAWAIEHVRKRLPIRQRNAPGYVFDLESCLCNWQMGK